MLRVNYLKKDHEEIFKGLFEFEEMIGQEDLDYKEISYIFQKITKLLFRHEQNEKFLLDEISKDYYMKIPLSAISLDPRRINGHIRVINKAISSKNQNFIRLALDNDGRMFISKVKDHVFKEEKIFDRLLFLHFVQQ